MRILTGALLMLFCLTSANVNADLLTSTQPQGLGNKMFEVSLWGGWNNISSVVATEFAGYDTLVRVGNENAGGNANDVSFFFNVPELAKFDYIAITRDIAALHGVIPATWQNGLSDIAISGTDIETVIPGTGAAAEVATWYYQPSGEGALVDSDGSFNLNFQTSNSGSVPLYYFNVAFYGTGSMTEPSPTPEPATLAILGLGLAGLGAVARRRVRK